MRMLMQVKLPLAKFNAAIKNGSVGDKMKQIVDALKPEAAYFTEIDGCRAVILIVDVADPSKVPSLAEPWFVTFDAEVRFHIVMSSEDLGRAGLEELGRKWA